MITRPGKVALEDEVPKAVTKTLAMLAMKRKGRERVRSPEISFYNFVKTRSSVHWIWFDSLDTLIMLIGNGNA
jgi:hypothetical protein